MIERVAVDALWVVLSASAPPVVVGGLVGLAAALLQAVTSVQESTLSFAPKSAAIIGTLIGLVAWYGAVFSALAHRCFLHVAELG
ncbi:MAG: flagellar biosynthetic protein FliQ [Myxococcota bacterium]